MDQASDLKQLEAAVEGRESVVLFHASWCPFCRAFKPAFDRLAGPGARFNPIEVLLDDEDDPLWETFSIEAVPTVLFFKGGKVARRLDSKPGVGLTEGDLRLALDAS